jgi:hypothetical protein
MKKLLTTAFFALTLFAANAQGTDAYTQASDLARRMASEIQLNEREYIEVRKLAVQKIERVNEIRSMYSNDADMRARKINEAEENFNYNLRVALNNKQFENYLAKSANYRVDQPVLAGAQEIVD